MKHSLNVTLLVVASFVVAQLIGLLVVSKYVDVPKSLETGKTEWRALPSVGDVHLERPDLPEQTSFIYVFISFLIGTGILLLIIYFRGVLLWKAWFFVAVSISLYIAFGAFFSPEVALVIALALSVVKVLRSTSFLVLLLQNGAELFVYGGLAAIFVPVFNLVAVSLLLLLVSIYDVYAVWKSQHMVTMAQFQSRSGVFAGLSIPYRVVPSEGKRNTSLSGRAESAKTTTAFLGGGDIALPLLFTGTVLKTWGTFPAVTIIPFTALALFLLLYFAQKDKFYPAMPFLSAGTFVGYGVAVLFA